MSCDPVTFNNVDTKVFDCLKGKLSALGLNLEGAKGSISGPMSIAVDYEWIEANSTLFIHVVSKNFLIPCSRVNAEIEKAIKQCADAVI